ncbi:ATP-binding protein [Rhodococcus sp. GB-02]
MFLLGTRAARYARSLRSLSLLGLITGILLDLEYQGSAPARTRGGHANLFVQLVSSRYEHASLVLTSNLPVVRWGDAFGDRAVAATMIDRIVHHTEVLTLKGFDVEGASYRLRNTGIECESDDLGPFGGEFAGLLAKFLAVGGRRRRVVCALR